MSYTQYAKLLTSAWGSCGLDLVASYVIGIISQFLLGQGQAGTISSVAPRPANALTAALTHPLMRAARQRAKRATVHGAGKLATRNARPRTMAAGTHREA